jgi:hypothetical protein
MSRTTLSTELTKEQAMYDIFYLIGVVVVILAVLSFLGVG